MAFKTGHPKILDRLCRTMQLNLWTTRKSNVPSEIKTNKELTKQDITPSVTI